MVGTADLAAHVPSAHYTGMAAVMCCQAAGDMSQVLQNVSRYPPRDCKHRCGYKEPDLGTATLFNPGRSLVATPRGVPRVALCAFQATALTEVDLFDYGQLVDHLFVPGSRPQAALAAG